MAVAVARRRVDHGPTLGAMSSEERGDLLFEDRLDELLDLLAREDLETLPGDARRGGEDVIVGHGRLSFFSL